MILNTYLTVKMSNKERPIPKTLGTPGILNRYLSEGVLFVDHSVARLADTLTFEVCKTKLKKKEKRQQSVKMFKSEKVHIIKM